MAAKEIRFSVDARDKMLRGVESSESWEPQAAPTSVALSCRWRSRPQHQKATLTGLNG